MPSAKLRVYSACWWLLLPVVLLRLCWRGRKEAGYLAHIPERFGLGKPLASPLIWVHVVSVGETRAAEPLILSLLQRYPSPHILLTHMTPTGRAAGAALFGREFKFEAYTPKRHRKFYFALPILADGELAGQLDAKLDGKRWRKIGRAHV